MFSGLGKLEVGFSPNTKCPACPAKMRFPRSKRKILKNLFSAYSRKKVKNSRISILSRTAFRNMSSKKNLLLLWKCKEKLVRIKEKRIRCYFEKEKVLVIGNKETRQTGSEPFTFCPPLISDSAAQQVEEKKSSIETTSKQEKLKKLCVTTTFHMRSCNSIYISLRHFWSSQLSLLCITSSGSLSSLSSPCPPLWKHTFCDCFDLSYFPPCLHFLQLSLAITLLMLILRRRQILRLKFTLEKSVLIGLAMIPYT